MHCLLLAISVCLLPSSGVTEAKQEDVVVFEGAGTLNTELNSCADWYALRHYIGPRHMRKWEAAGYDYVSLVAREFHPQIRRLYEIILKTPALKKNPYSNGPASRIRPKTKIYTEEVLDLLADDEKRVFRYDKGRERGLDLKMIFEEKGNEVFRILDALTKISQHCSFEDGQSLSDLTTCMKPFMPIIRTGRAGTWQENLQALLWMLEDTRQFAPPLDQVIRNYLRCTEWIDENSVNTFLKDEFEMLTGFLKAQNETYNFDMGATVLAYKPQLKKIASVLQNLDVQRLKSAIVTGIVKFEEKLGDSVWFKEKIRHQNILDRYASGREPVLEIYMKESLGPLANDEKRLRQLITELRQFLEDAWYYIGPFASELVDLIFKGESQDFADMFNSLAPNVEAWTQNLNENTADSFTSDRVIGDVLSYIIRTLPDPVPVLDRTLIQILEDKYFEMEPERKKVQFLLGSDEFAYKSLLYFFVVKNTQML